MLLCNLGRIHFNSHHLFLAVGRKAGVFRPVCKPLFLRRACTDFLVCKLRVHLQQAAAGETFSQSLPMPSRASKLKIPLQKTSQQAPSSHQRPQPASAKRQTELGFLGEAGDDKMGRCNDSTPLKDARAHFFCPSFLIWLRSPTHSSRQKGTEITRAVTCA